MSVIVLLIVAGGVVAAGFLCAFIWAVRSGQYDDTCTPAIRVLLEERGRSSSRRGGFGEPAEALGASAEGRSDRDLETGH